MIKEGDWVVGTFNNRPFDGALILGYVTAVNHYKDAIVKVTVCEEKPYLVGIHEKVKTWELSKVDPYLTPKEAKELIDIALKTGDKEWFNRLANIISSNKLEVIDYDNIPCE